MNEITLTDVLEGYAIETPTGNDQKILQEWMRRHPQFAAELMDFAAARAFAAFAPEEELSTQEEERYRELGLNALRSFLDRNERQDTIASLTDSAKEKGLNKAKFAAAVGVSLSLLMYLEKKRLEFASIPKAVVQKIADVLETGENAISSYLSGPQNLAAQTSYKAAERPEEGKLKSFAEAVAKDQTLSAEEKKKLLSLR